LWRGPVGILFKPNTRKAIASKGLFASDEMVEQQCYQEALAEKKHGLNPDFRGAFLRAEDDIARKSGKSTRFFESDEHQLEKFVQMALIQQGKIDRSDKKVLLFEALKGIGKTKLNPTDAALKSLKKRFTRQYMEKGQIAELYPILVAIEKLEKMDMSKRQEYLRKASPVTGAANEDWSFQYSSKPMRSMDLKPNEAIIMPEQREDGSHDVAAILLTDTQPDNCRLGLDLRRCFYDEYKEYVPFVTYSSHTGELRALSLQEVEEISGISKAD